MSLPPKLFDRALVARRLSHRRRPEADFVTQLALDDLASRLLTISRPFRQALIMGPDASLLPTSGRSSSGSFTFDRAATLLPTPGLPLLEPEALRLPRDDYELIVSVLDLQIVNDVPGFLARIRAHLAPDGLFMAVALGGDSLTELRQAFLAADAEFSGGAFTRVAPFIPLAEAGGLLQRAGYALPVTDVETHVVRYANPLALMAELRQLGAANPMAERPARLATRRLLAAAIAAYADLATDPDGRVRATLELVWISGWAPHQSQQQPLRRGSAKVSLKDVLSRS